MKSGEETKLKRKFQSFGYSNVKQLATGEWAGTQAMVYTTGLMVGLDNTGYRTRFCYPNQVTATEALKEWDGFNDPPGPWIKEKGAVERSNPNGSVPKRV